MLAFRVMGAATVTARFVAKLSAPRQVRIAQRPRVHESDRRRAACRRLLARGPGRLWQDHRGARLPARRQGAATVWYRVDEGDQDIASFFHYLARTLRSGNGARRCRCSAPNMPSGRAISPACSSAPISRSWSRGTRCWRSTTCTTPTRLQFRAMLAVLLRELPDGIRCICLSRTLPPGELSELGLRGRLMVVDESSLAFSDAKRAPWSRCAEARGAGRRRSRARLGGRPRAAGGTRAGRAERPATISPAAGTAVFAALGRPVVRHLADRRTGLAAGTEPAAGDHVGPGEQR